MADRKDHADWDSAVTIDEDDSDDARTTAPRLKGVRSEK
ncbi:MAG: hypothetical protein JWQ12_2341 [Glaciihabitans sp.]|nr:hypothetical protein [Glaciihabitans sp.]